MDCGLQIPRTPNQTPMAPPNSPLSLYDVTRTSFDPFQLPETADYHSYISAAVYNIAMTGPESGEHQDSTLSRLGYATGNAFMHEYIDKTGRDIPAGMKKVEYAKVHPASFMSVKTQQKTNAELQRIANLFCVEPDTRCKQVNKLNGVQPQGTETDEAEMRKYIDITGRDIVAVCNAQQTTQRPRPGHATNNAGMRKYMGGSKRAVRAGLRKEMHAKVYPTSIDSGKKLQKANTELQHIAGIFCVKPCIRFTHTKEIDSSTNNNALQANIMDGAKPQKNEISRYTVSQRRSFRKSRKVCPCNVEQDQSRSMSKDRKEKIASMFCVETKDGPDMSKKRRDYCGDAYGDNSKDIDNKSGRRNPVFAFFQGLKRLVTRR